jgi:broad specificity phosphatase PhoE
MKDADMNVRTTPNTTPLDVWAGVATAGLQSREQVRARLADQPDAPDVELCLVRHGETTTNAAGLFTGTTDAPLNVKGRLQAQEAGRAIAGRAFDIGFTSQLSRSIETLALMTRAGGLTLPFTAADARLAERSYGELERTPIRPRDPRLAVDLTLAPTGGESYIALTRRILSFLLDLRALAAALPRPPAIIISTHMGPMRVLTAILDETTDPVAMRNANFANGAVVQRTLRALAWPAFAGGLPAAESPEIPEFLQ